MRPYPPSTRIQPERKGASSERKLLDSRSLYNTRESPLNASLFTAFFCGVFRSLIAARLDSQYSRTAARFEVLHLCKAGAAKLNVGHSHLCGGVDCEPVIDSVTTMACA
jgi:hypothetical protein